MEQTTRTEDVVRRERKAKRLADKLFFELDRQGNLYSLRRTAGVSGIVRREITSAWTRSNANLRCGSSEDPTAVKVIRFECSLLRSPPRE